MNLEEKIKLQKDKLSRMRRIGPRLAALRKKKKIKESEFCDKYNFSRAWFNRIKNLNDCTEEALASIETALSAEGV